MPEDFKTFRPKGHRVRARPALSGERVYVHGYLVTVRSPSYIVEEPDGCTRVVGRQAFLANYELAET